MAIGVGLSPRGGAKKARQYFLDVGLFLFYDGPLCLYSPFRKALPVLRGLLFGFPKMNVLPRKSGIPEVQLSRQGLESLSEDSLPLPSTGIGH